MELIFFWNFVLPHFISAGLFALAEMSIFVWASVRVMVRTAAHWTAMAFIPWSISLVNRDIGVTGCHQRRDHVHFVLFLFR